MLNKEKFKEEIWDYILEHGHFPAITKDGLKNCRLTNCINDRCVFYRAYSNCEEGLLEWLNSEYVEHEIDWTKVSVDTPVLVSNGDGKWNKRYFARFENGKVKTWVCGATSWSTESNSDVVSWEYAKLANEEDVWEYRKE